MRLTLVSSSLGAGGAERVVSLVALGLGSRGHHVSVVTLSGGDDDFYPLPSFVERVALGLLGKPVSLWSKFPSIARRLFVLRRAVLATRPDAVISFLDQMNVTTLLSLTGRRIPVVVTEHVSPRSHPLGAPWVWLRRRTYPRAARVVSVSAGVDGYFTWIAEGKRAVIYNPLPPMGPGIQAADISNAPSPRTVIAMGRLENQKGFDLLLDAFARLRPAFMDWRLVILGEGSRRASLERQIRELDLQDTVDLPGLVRDPFPALRRAALFVFPSRYEGFGNVIVEALACGLPVVAADCPSGPREILSNGEAGVLVPPEDVEALAVAMRWLMADEVARGRLASRAAAVASRFTLDKIMDDWERLLLPLRSRCD